MAIFFALGLLSGVFLARLLWFDALKEISERTTKPASAVRRTD
jgi:hypothetical protein